MSQLMRDYVVYLLGADVFDHLLLLLALVDVLLVDREDFRLAVLSPPIQPLASHDFACA